MAHKRKEIRDAVAALLIAADTDAEDRVFSNRETKLWQEELPAIVVYSETETATPRDLSGRQYIRTLEMRVVAIVESNTGLDDALDSLAEDIENAISADRSLTGTAITAKYTGTQFTIEAEGEKLTGKVELTFDVQYFQ